MQVNFLGFVLEHCYLYTNSYTLRPSTKTHRSVLCVLYSTTDISVSFTVRVCLLLNVPGPSAGTCWSVSLVLYKSCIIYVSGLHCWGLSANGVWLSARTCRSAIWIYFGGCDGGVGVRGGIKCEYKVSFKVFFCYYLFTSQY